MSFELPLHFSPNASAHACLHVRSVGGGSSVEKLCIINMIQKFPAHGGLVFEGLPMAVVACLIMWVSHSSCFYNCKVFVYLDLNKKRTHKIQMQCQYNSNLHYAKHCIDVLLPEKALCTHKISFSSILIICSNSHLWYNLKNLCQLLQN